MAAEPLDDSTSFRKASKSVGDNTLMPAVFEEEVGFASDAFSDSGQFGDSGQIVPSFFMVASSRRKKCVSKEITGPLPSSLAPCSELSTGDAKGAGFGRSQPRM